MKTREIELKSKGRTITAADLFCGAGGTSQGLIMAANELQADLELVAINHWSVAIDTHSLNHPYAHHLCTGLDNVDPRKLVPGGRLNVMCASPECTHHSVARGGKPMSDQSRSSAWHILRFAEALYIDNLVIENVKEFQSWGPLGANGRPLKSKKGQLFNQFIESLRALGYTVEWRVLNCADYGDPTTRERLFMIARRGNKKIKWPAPTHMRPAHSKSLFVETRLPWRTAREIIDWTIPSRSIFDRKKPLADKTLRRIEAGLRKFCKIDVNLRKCIAEDLRPFLVVFRNNADSISVDEPIPTVTTSGNHFGLVEPFPVLLRKGQGARSVDEPLATLTTKGANYGVAEPFVIPQGRRNPPRDIDRPLDTITTTSRGVGMVQPFLSHFRGDHAGRDDGAGRNGSLADPLPTQDTSNRFGLVEPFIVPQFGEREGQSPRCHSVDSPAPAVTSHGAGALVEPFMMPIDHTGSGADVARSIDSPISTLVTKANQAVVTPYLVTVNHGEDGGTRKPMSIDEPFPVVTQKIGEAVCEPFLVSYYGTENMSAADDPVPTVTTKDRFAIVEAHQERYMLDIRFRMLSPRELARAQGFPDSYEFTGNREAVVKQIGNAVPPGTARALLMEVLA